MASKHKSSAYIYFTLTSDLKYYTGVFLRRMLGTRYGPVGTRFLCSRDPGLIFADSEDPIFNSMDPNRVPGTRLKKP